METFATKEMLSLINPPKLRKIKLGKWQIKCLEMIVKHQACCSHSVMSMVIGTAKSKWNNKYQRSLSNAIAAHNNGRATNSPLPNTIKIKEVLPGDKMSPGDRAGFIVEDLSI